MKSALKYLLPIALLMGIVFAVTVFSWHKPPEEPDKKDEQLVPTTRALEYFTTTRKWELGDGTLLPDNTTSLQDVAFTGYYEAGEVTNATQFWFRNRHPGPVTLKLAGVNCGSCSGARVAVIPPSAAEVLYRMAGFSVLPFGPVAACPTGMAGAGTVFSNELKWEAHTFLEGNVSYTIPPPATGSPWAMPLGILELNFKVKPNPRVPLSARFATFDEAGQPLQPDDLFSIFYAQSQPAEVDKSAIDAGELADNTQGRTHVVTVYSSTRGPGELPGLTARVINPGGAPPGPFVTTGPPEPVPHAELAALAADYTARAKQPVRVRSAYRIPVTVVGRVGDARPDIGRLEREVWIDTGVPGADPRKISVKAAVTGPVTIAGGATELNLGSFKHQGGAAETVLLSTDQPDAPLVVVPGTTQPDFLDVSLKKLPEGGGRGQWQLTVRVPANRVQGELTDGLVVLELKGPNPQRIRIPVRGRGVL
ncbi:hypothetical protein [Urbifossiella limnaea]|uniref:Uncharacterized protein n=1 Tax=Urbifossiella limnaea TaxID=2528023 RepID=A0A517XR83_9BACT|nr:hypothetical protein [Urbifossiella limnaea]QDU20016.1 hypothetical protein ETAA1_19590 [Urbifossiella limnaea]